MSTLGDVESTSSSLPNSVPGSPAGSPTYKLKFLCSYGGKILPRPTDGHLKYVGGETRVISVHRNITFIDLMRKLSSLIEGDVILKYQLLPEELDALVTVKSDEDLCHMFEEYDRQELAGTSRLRTFLFPANPIIVQNQMGPMDRWSLEQRYISSINGVIFHPDPIYNNTRQANFTIGSACSSPNTPHENTIHNMPTAHLDVINPEITSARKLGAMTKARSSPNLCNLGSPSQTNQKSPTHMSISNLGLTNQQYLQQRQPQPQSQPYHMIYPQAHHNPHSSPKPPLDHNPHKNVGLDHLMRVRSSGVADYYRHPTEPSQHSPNSYGRSSRGGHMVYQRGSPYDEYYGNNNTRCDRESPPGSPLGRSSLHSNYSSKWDSVGGR